IADLRVLARSRQTLGASLSLKVADRSASHSKPNAEGYRSSIRDCRSCPLQAACFSPNAHRLHKDHPALLRARRRHLLGPSVNESSMPPIAHVSRAFTEKTKLGMGWPGRYSAVSPT